jgi:hypothetical protein
MAMEQSRVESTRKDETRNNGLRVKGECMYQGGKSHLERLQGRARVCGDSGEHKWGWVEEAWAFDSSEVRLQQPLRQRSGSSRVMAALNWNAMSRSRFVFANCIHRLG